MLPFNIPERAYEANEEFFFWFSEVETHTNVEAPSQTAFWPYPSRNGLDLEKVQKRAT